MTMPKPISLSRYKRRRDKVAEMMRESREAADAFRRDVCAKLGIDPDPDANLTPAQRRLRDESLHAAMLDRLEKVEPPLRDDPLHAAFLDLLRKTT